MPDTKTTNLVEGTDPTLADFFMMVDVDDPTMSVAGSNKKVTGANVLELYQESLANRDQPINAQTGSSYSPVLSDRAKLVTLSDAGDIDLELPEDATLDFPDGAFFDVIQLSVGQVYFVPEGGIPAWRTRQQGSRARVQKVGVDTWHVSGDIEATV
jgi:hypothetical protein